MRREVGRQSAIKPLPGPRPLVYDHALEQLAETAGEVVRFEDLLEY
jgi:hypothetical protein